MWVNFISNRSVFNVYSVHITVQRAVGKDLGGKQKKKKRFPPDCLYP